MSAPHHDLVQDAGGMALRTLPPVAIGWLTLNNVLVVLSIVWIAVQMAFLARRWWIMERERKATRA